MEMHYNYGFLTFFKKSYQEIKKNKGLNGAHQLLLYVADVILLGEDIIILQIQTHKFMIAGSWSKSERSVPEYLDVRDEVTGGLIKLLNELHTLYSSSNIVIIKSRRVRWVGHGRDIHLGY